MPSARPLFLTSLAVGLTLVLTAAGDQPAPPAPTAGLPVGLWTIEFSNGVSEACALRPDGSAAVVELKRTSAGKAEVKEDAVVIRFEDDRVERWTPVGRRMVVEHWYPAAQFPTGKPVLGIGQRSR
jgi:hypothetical protein